MSKSVELALHGFLDAILVSEYKDVFVGQLDPAKLRMPASQKDGRKCSWIKKFKSIATRITKEVKDVKRNCWMYELKGGDTNYGLFKLGNQMGKGDQGHFRVHRVLFALKNPEYHASMLKDDNSSKLQCSHLCGKGWSAAKGQGSICINPYHVILETCKENQARKVTKTLVLIWLL